MEIKVDQIKVAGEMWQIMKVKFLSRSSSTRLNTLVGMVINSGLKEPLWHYLLAKSGLSSSYPWKKLVLWGLLVTIFLFSETLLEVALLCGSCALNYLSLQHGIGISPGGVRRSQIWLAYSSMREASTWSYFVCVLRKALNQNRF